MERSEINGRKIIKIGSRLETDNFRVFVLNGEKIISGVFELKEEVLRKKGAP
jgi:hypothetical protein